MKCKLCQNDIPKKRLKRNSIYCSNKCRKIDYKDNKKLSRSSGLATGTTGASSELLVAVDLMNKGYDVFRALSPSSRFDLVAVKEDEILKIEVRTASLYLPTGALSCNKNHSADMLAIVTPDCSIKYEQ